MGPVSAAVATTDPVFRHYSGGIITSETCGSMVDCAVTIVGYGQEQGREYWLVKNSWGTSNYPEGYLYVSEAYFKLKTINIYLHKEAIQDQLRAKIGI